MYPYIMYSVYIVITFVDVASPTMNVLPSKARFLIYLFYLFIYFFYSVSLFVLICHSQQRTVRSTIVSCTGRTLFFDCATNVHWFFTNGFERSLNISRARKWGFPLAPKAWFAPRVGQLSIETFSNESRMEFGPSVVHFWEIFRRTIDQLCRAIGANAA